MLGRAKQSFDKWQRTMENDIVDRFPNIAKHIDSIHLSRSVDSGLSSAARSGGLYMAQDSNYCAAEVNPLAKGNRAIQQFISDSTKAYIDKQMDSLVSKGYSEENAKKQVMDSLTPLMAYDREHNCYLTTVAPTVNGKVTDSVLEQMAIPFWNVATVNKLWKQPFATSFAKNLVSVESFSNAWADFVVLYKEAFEGFGKVSTVAKGNIRQNNSNPITNEATQLVTEVFNLSIDYESNMYEDLKAKQHGNWLTGQLKADRMKYGAMVLERMQDALIYFGSDEAGIDGLMQKANVELYNGTPLYDMLTGSSATKGADIVLAMNKLIGDFLRSTHYMAREVKINCSEYVFQALTQTVYSDNYNPDSPLKILTGNFKGGAGLDAGLTQCRYTITSDTMLNPNTIWNPSNEDLMFITVPKISDALSGQQSGLIIHPELVKNFVLNPLAVNSRSGNTFTIMKRIGGIIAPIDDLVLAIRGFGKQ